MEQKLVEIVKKYITDHKISCPETICQQDSVILDAYDFIEDLCNVVGYYQYMEDD